MRVREQRAEEWPAVRELIDRAFAVALGLDGGHRRTTRLPRPLSR